MGKIRIRVLIAMAALGLLPAALRAQGVAPMAPQGPASEGAGLTEVNTMVQKQWIVAGQVVTLDGNPVRAARVQVSPINVGAEFRTLDTNVQGEFRTDYFINSDFVKNLSVEVAVTKKGFRKAYTLVEVRNSDSMAWMVRVTLRDAAEDPALLSQADLVSTLAPRLKTLGAADGLSAAGEKDYARGAEEFLDRKRADRALPHFKKAAQRDPACAACLTMLGLAELEAGDWDSAHRDVGQAADKTLANRPRGRPEPLLIYGVMESWRHEPKNASGFFFEALKLAPQDPLALQEIGRAQLALENWGSASDYLKQAVAAGAAPPVRLLLVQALLRGGDFDAANQEMARYLNGRDIKSMPLPVRELWAAVAEKKKIEAAYLKVKSDVNQPVDYLHRTVPELKDLVPASDQTPLDSILGAVGKQVEAYFHNFPNTVSLEEIHQEKLTHKGKVEGTLDQKFQYLCLAPQEETGLGFTEYRANMAGEKGLPQGLNDGYMLTSGFASASLIFHPTYQGEATFRYLGRQKIGGRDTFVLAFAQRPEKARLYGRFKMGETSMPTFSQGLAWVDAGSYEILRLRSDLLRPLLDVRLEKETTEIDFSENHFKSIAEAFWLPREVRVSVDWNGKSLRNRHAYSDFKLFNVGATERIGKPKEAAQEESPTPSPN
jgi:hypothetical protein